MKRHHWTHIYLFLLTLIFSFLLSGCNGTLSDRKPSEGTNPFSDDHVATVRIVMTEEDWSSCLTNAFEERYVKGDFWFDDELVPDISVRPKGNSTLGQAVGWDSPRIPLAIDFNLFNRARSFRGIKKVVLNNGWADPTLIRECLAYEIFAKMDIPTPRSSLVDVWVNDNHLGVYTMAEAIDATLLGLAFAYIADVFGIQVGYGFCGLVLIIYLIGHFLSRRLTIGNID